MLDKRRNRQGTDHTDRHNCVVDWEGANVMDRETNRCARWIK